jgi:HEAT repeat protein
MLGITVQRKIWQLKSGNAETRAAAVTALASLGNPRAVAGLGNVLQDEERGLRVAAAQALGAIGHPSAVGPLISALRTEKTWEVRHEIVEALRKIGDPNAVNQLVLVLESDRDEGAREFAAWALKAFGWNKLAPQQQALIAIMQDDWPMVRRLGAAATEPLHDALRSGSPRIRRYSAEALAAIGDDRAMAALLDALDTDDAELRTIAAHALEEKAWARLQPDRLALVAVILGKWPAAVSAGTAALKPLRDALTTADRETKRHIVDALVSIGGPDASAVLLEVAHDDDVAVRRAAAQALAASPDRDATAALVTALADEDIEVRRSAGSGLKSAGWRPPNDSARARLAIACGDANALIGLGVIAAEELIDDLLAPSLRLATIQLLRSLGPLGTDALLATIDHSAAELRVYAIEALALVGDTGALPHLMKLLTDKDVEVRRTAVRAMRQLGWEPAADVEHAAVLVAIEDWDEVAACGSLALEPLLQCVAQKHCSEQALRSLEQLLTGQAARQLSIEQLSAVDQAVGGASRTGGGSSRLLVAGPVLRQSVMRRRIAQLARAELQRRKTAKSS